MTQRSKIFSVARKRLDELFEDMEGHSEAAVRDMAASGVSDEDLADTATVRATVAGSWAHSLNRTVELQRRKEPARWRNLYTVFALIMEELDGERPTPREFIDVIGDHTSWPEDDRVSLNEHIEASLTSGRGNRKKSATADKAVTGNDPTTITEAPTSEQVEPKPAGDADEDVVTPVEKPAPKKKVPVKRAPRRRAKRKKKSVESEWSLAESTPMSDNDGRGGDAIVSGDLDYRVTDVGQIEDRYLINGNITANDPHAHQLVRGVGSYAAEKAIVEIETGLRARGVEVAGTGVGRGAAVTAALIAVLGLDEEGMVELSPAMSMAVRVLRQGYQERSGLRLSEMQDETRRTRDSVKELEAKMEKLLENTEVNGRLSATVVADRSGIAPIPVTRDPEDIEVLSHGAQQVYDQAESDVRSRIEIERGRQQRSRKG